MSAQQQVLIQESIMEGMQYMQAQELDMAEEAFSAALDQSEAHFGEAHHITRRCLEYSARCIMTMKNYELATPMFERLVEISENSDSENNKNENVEASMATVFMDLAECYRSCEGKEEDAARAASRGAKSIDVFKEKMEEEAKKPPPPEEDEDEENEDEQNEEEKEDEEEDEEEEKEENKNAKWKL